MSINISSNSLARVNSGDISSVDEALDVTSSIQFALTDTIRNSLSDQLIEGAGLVNKLLAVSDILKRVKAHIGGPFQPINYDAIKNSPKTEKNLTDLFQNDGPRLGNSISEGLEILNEANALGADLKAEVVFPFLTETRNEKDEMVSTSFEWLTQAQITDRMKGESTPTSCDFPLGAASIVKDGSSRITYTDLSAYGIVRPDLQTVNSTFAKISQIVDGFRDQLIGLLANSSKSAEQLEFMVSRFLEAGKVQETRKSESAEKFRSELVETLRKMNVFKYEKYIYDENIEKPMPQLEPAQNSADPDKKKQTSISPVEKESNLSPTFLKNDSSF